MARAPDDEPPPEKNPYRLDEAEMRRLCVQREMCDRKREAPRAHASHAATEPGRLAPRERQLQARSAAPTKLVPLRRGHFQCGNQNPCPPSLPPSRDQRRGDCCHRRKNGGPERLNPSSISEDRGGACLPDNPSLPWNTSNARFGDIGPEQSGHCLPASWVTMIRRGTFWGIKRVNKVQSTELTKFF